MEDIAPLIALTRDSAGDESLDLILVLEAHGNMALIARHQHEAHESAPVARLDLAHDKRLGLDGRKPGERPHSAASR